MTQLLIIRSHVAYIVFALHNWNAFFKVYFFAYLSTFGEFTILYNFNNVVLVYNSLYLNKNNNQNNIFIEYIQNRCMTFNIIKI